MGGRSRPPARGPTRAVPSSFGCRCSRSTCRPPAPRRRCWRPDRGEEEVMNRAASLERVGGHRSLRVLFVDDEAPLRELMRTELPRMGHEITVCQDGRAALKVLERSTFDAAILDLRMPGMTGIEV